MKLFRKNQIVITALAALIAVAETETVLPVNAEPENSEETKETGADVAAAGQDIESNDIDIEGEPGEAVLVNAAGTVDFIVEAKLAREEVRANSKESLMQIINNESLSEQDKALAVERMVKLTENAEKESAAESMIQAKGYKNVAVTISEEGVDVMVVADSLDGTARAQIEEIVKTKAGVSADKITITAVKNLQK